MLFRTGEGKLIEVKKYDFKNDTLYFERLMKLKSLTPKISKNIL